MEDLNKNFVSDKGLRREKQLIDLILNPEKLVDFFQIS
jgi:hypothetical protein